MRTPLLIGVLLAAGAASGAATLPDFEQAPRVVTDAEWCQESQESRRRGHCEVREFTVARPSAGLHITDSPNGGIAVTGASRSDMVIRAKVQTWAETEEAAREIAGNVRVTIDNGRVTTEGPRTGRRESWSVSYRAEVPAATDLELDTSNGSVSVSNVNGTLQLSSSNGSLRLTGVGGDVRGRTSNGSVHVTLTGQSWSGAGLDVRTSNGSARIDIPENFNARLVASTSNGSLRTDIPVTVQGRVGRDIDTTLGSGGATIRVSSSNGSVRIGRPDSSR